MDHPVYPAHAPAARALSARALLLPVLAAAVVAPALFWHGGVLEEETIVFLRNHWSDRGTLQEVFDPHRNDFGTYQARELSYFLDHLDAQVLRSLLRRGIDFFIPASALVAAALVVAVFFLGVRATMPALDPVTAALVLLLYLTNFIFLSTMGVFYRATKPLLAPLLLALLFVLWRERRNPSASPGAAGAVLGLCLAMSLLDRQGFFYTVALSGGLALAWVFRRRHGRLLLGASAAVALALAYNFVVGPRLVQALNGYWPRFRYQRLAFAKLADGRFYAQGAELLADYAGSLLGNVPAVVGSVLLLAALVVAWRRGRAPAVGLAAFVLASQVVMLAAMIMRYPQVHDWIDHRLWYYPLPFQALALFAVLLLAEGASPRLARLALVVLIAANIAGWRRNRDAMAAGPWFAKTYSQSSLFRASLRSGRPEEPLYGAYRDFYYEVRDLSPVLRARSQPDVRRGEGLYPTQLRDGRVFAWARASASLRLDAPGPCRIEGELWLRAGERVRVGDTTVEGPAAGESSVPFSVKAESPELPLRAEHPEREVGTLRDPRAAAFGVWFPVRIRPQSP